MTTARRWRSCGNVYSATDGHFQHLFGNMGVPTGLDFTALMALREQVAQWLAGETPHGAIWRAGLPKTMTTSVA